MSTATVAMEAAKKMGGRMDFVLLPGGHHKPGRDSSFSHFGMSDCGPRTAARHGSHVHIDRSLTALRGDPIDVPVRIFDVAGLAVDAVLRVDHELRLTSLLDPLVNPGRAVAARRTGEDVVLGA